MWLKEKNKNLWVLKKMFSQEVEKGYSLPLTRQ